MNAIQRFLGSLHVSIALTALLAVCPADVSQAADAAAALSHRVEPLSLQAQPGWLDGTAVDSPIDLLAADSNDEKATPAADRAAIVAAARHTLATNDSAATKAFARSAGDADVRVHATGQGAYVVQFEQRVEGIEVLGARINVLLDRTLRVRAITGGVGSAAPAADSAFRRDASNALQSAAGAVDGLLAASALHEVDGKPPYRYFKLERSPTFIPNRTARIKPIWYPAAQGLLPAYYAEIAGHQPNVERPRARAVIVAADDGRVLSSADLVHDYQAFAYRVFATPQGVPYNDPYGFTTPHPTGLPDGYRPSVLAPMNLVSLRNAGVSTGDPWLPDGATETVGNNVDSFFDADQVDGDGACTFEGVALYTGYSPAEGDMRAQLTATHAFDYPYDANDTAHDYLQCATIPALPVPTTSAQLNAKIVQMFYAGNWLHDYFYDLGFDEAAGNLQQDNHGRGGIGGDPLMMVSGGSHPYTYTADEGQSTLISMGISSYSLSRRDTTAFDFAVIGHEWTHAMMERLTPQLNVTGQYGALAEGSADLIGHMLIVRAQDRNVYPGKPPFHGVYPASGAYDNLDYDISYDTLPPAGSPGNPDNTYYHGVRRFPISADMAVNPLTFGNIGIDHPLPASPPYYDWLGRSLANAEIHTAGEIWSAAMWECARNILVASAPARFEQTRRRFLGDVVVGFKLFRPDPTFTEARDAMLDAIRADNEADYRRCRAGFAKRGMGAGAISPERYSANLVGTVESFDDRERALSIVGTRLVEFSGGDGDDVLDRGELGHLEVSLQNTGFSPLAAIRVRVQASPANYSFPNGRQVDGVALAAGATTTVSIDVRVASGQGAVELPLAVSARDQHWPTADAQSDAKFRVNYDLVRDQRVDHAASEPTFAADWVSGFPDPESGTFCYYFLCALQWQPARHRGESAYVIRDDRHIGFDSTLTGRDFLVSATHPLRITLRHDYDFDRAAGDPLGGPGVGLIGVSIDGGAWEDIAPYVATGPALFEGISNGWRTDTLDFATALAGHRVQFRWEAFASGSFTSDPAYWAISRVQIEGAEEAMFSRVVADVP